MLSSSFRALLAAIHWISHFRVQFRTAASSSYFSARSPEKKDRNKEKEEKRRKRPHKIIRTGNITDIPQRMTPTNANPEMQKRKKREKNKPDF